MPLELSKQSRRVLEDMRADFPDSSSLLIPAIKLAQSEFGELSKEVLAVVASELVIPESVVAGVATFYHNFHTGGVGRHLISVCRTLSCELEGASEIMRRFEELLGIKAGETTEDGLITLQSVECLACCGLPPAVQVDFDYFESFKPQQCEEVIEALREGCHPEGGAGVPGGIPDEDVEVRV